jgi:hypothetical protein
LQSIAEDIYNRGAVGAVSHGPAILTGMRTPDGEFMIKDKTISGLRTKAEVELEVKIRAANLKTVEELAKATGAHYEEPRLPLRTSARSILEL